MIRIAILSLLVQSASPLALYSARNQKSSSTLFSKLALGLYLSFWITNEWILNALQGCCSERCEMFKSIHTHWKSLRFMLSLNISHLSYTWTHHLLLSTVTSGILLSHLFKYFFLSFSFDIRMLTFVLSLNNSHLSYTFEPIIYAMIHSFFWAFSFFLLFLSFSFDI